MREFLTIDHYTFTADLLRGALQERENETRWYLSHMVQVRPHSRETLEQL